MKEGYDKEIAEAKKRETDKLQRLNSATAEEMLDRNNSKKVDNKKDYDFRAL